MKENMYYKDENGKIFQISVCQEDCSFGINPRKDYDNLAHMMCWYRNYSLGDENSFGSPDTFLDELIQKEYNDNQIISYVKRGKTSNNLEIKYNRSEKTYQLIGDYRVWWNSPNTIHRGEIDSQPDVKWLVDSILECLPINDKLKMLSKAGYIFFPLSVYEHSGITMYIGSPDDHFDGQWDCSNVGWIYINKKEVFESGCQMQGKSGRYLKTTSRNWKDVAKQICESEADIYDMYLVGDVYCATISELDADITDTEYLSEIAEDKDNWNETESCGGFFSRKWGDELFTEIAKDMVGNIQLYDSVSMIP